MKSPPPAGLVCTRWRLREIRMNQTENTKNMIRITKMLMPCHMGMVLLLVGSLAGQALAAVIWTGGGADDLWSTAANWDSGVPGAADDAYLASAGATGLIDGTVAAEANHVRVANTAGAVSLDITTGGTLDAAGIIYLGYANVGTVGTLNIDGGSVSAGTYMYVGNWGSGVLNMTAGTLDATVFMINNANTALTSGHVQLDGGAIDADWLVVKPNGTMDITGEGYLVYNSLGDGGTGTTIEEVIDNGFITAYGEADEVLVDTNSVPGRTILSTVPYSAWNPGPRDHFAQHVSTNANLYWSAGFGAINHKVYLGIDFDAVADANESSNEYKESLDVGVTSYNPDIAYDTTYYWRIDEWDGSETHKGDIWTFRTREYFGPEQKMLAFMNSTLDEDIYIGVNSQTRETIDDPWEPNWTYQPFKSRVNSLWRQVYWRKDQPPDYYGELFTYDDDVIMLHAESFPKKTYLDPPEQPEWDQRPDRLRLFIQDDEPDWSRGRVFAPVDGSTNWHHEGYIDTYMVNSYDEINNKTAQLYQNHFYDSSVFIMIETYPFSTVFDGEADGWPAGVDFQTFDEVLIIHQEMYGDVGRERFFFARKGETYYGMVRWDNSITVNGQWHVVQRTTGLTLLQNGNFSFEGFYDRSRNDNWIADADGDCDGLPDVWEFQYFGGTSNGGADDWDLNGFDNLSEYIAGTVPTNGNSLLRLDGEESNPAGFVLNWNSVTGRVYGVNWTESLTNAFQPLPPMDLPYPANSYTDIMHGVESKGFYRLDVRLEP